MTETAEVLADEFNEYVNRLEMAGLTKEHKQKAAEMGRDEARYLVDSYYQMQDYRKASANQKRSAEGPAGITEWLTSNVATLENNCKLLLHYYAKGSPVGQWGLSITGIGPVISAALLAYIDIAKSPNAGSLWRYAGLDPSISWLGRDKAAAAVKDALGRSSGPVEYEDLCAVAAKTNRKAERLQSMMQHPTPTGDVRPFTVATLQAELARPPWNADLKCLAWKIGECFVKVSNHEKDFYGHRYAERKAFEVQQNEAGAYADQAARKLEQFNIGKSTDAYAAYSQGKLPPAHLHSRAKRWAVKLFLAHWHEVAFYDHYGFAGPAPYAIVHAGHEDRIAVPNWPF